MDDIYDWLGLNHLTKLTLPQKHQLLKYFKTPSAILDARSLDKLIPNLDVSNTLRTHLNQDLIQRTQVWLDKSSDHHVIAYNDSLYPSALKQINAAPLILYLYGNPRRLNDPQIAIIGSRKATIAGKQTAQRFASELVNLGLTITSGLALGIDSAAHQGALHGGGRTIAVLGTGIDRCYPSAHQKLRLAISQDGALVSEFALGSPPRRVNFPQRNRLISGLSQGVLVVEAAQRSGSLITAAYALDQNREVFAIPGSIYAHNTDGCLSLIQKGAKLTRNVNDIIEELNGFSARAINNNKTASIDILPETETTISRAIYRLLSDAPISFDKIIHQSGLTIDQLCSILLNMELIGEIEKLPGGLYIRTAPQKGN